MELADRLAALERRVAALEEAGAPAGAPAGGPTGGPTTLPGDAFWALEGFKAQIAEAEEEGGGVLYTGAVEMAAGERYEWQEALPARVLLEADDDGSVEATAEVLSALGHPVRLRLLREILAGRRTTVELTGLEGVGTTGQIYHHLRLLAAAGWLHATGRGRYEVPAGRVVPLLVALAVARR